MPTADQMNAVVEAYVAGFAAGDADAIADLFADDATVEDPVGSDIRRGKAAIREFYGYSTATGARLKLAGDPRCAGSYVAFPFAVLLDLEGRKSAIEVIDTFQINDDGKIVEMRAFWGPENIKPV